MTRSLIVLLILCLLAFAGYRTFRHRSATTLPEKPVLEDRVANARSTREEILRRLCAGRNLAYPPSELFLRGIKSERLLEVWAGEKGQQLQLLKSYPLTAFSGHLGPKRREGDRQIPEGVYAIDRFNPRSLYHLSLGLNYPNTSDRVFADPQHPGGDIFIHGGAASVGCLAIGDDSIEELFVLASDVRAHSKREIPVHIFPARMGNSTWRNLAASEASDTVTLNQFWDRLAPVFTSFEQHRRVPEVGVDERGYYTVKASVN